MSQVTTPVEKPVHFENRDIVFESGGVKFVIHVTADMSGTAGPGPKPTPDPEPIPGGNTGPDGVKLLFAENKQAKIPPFYLNIDNPDADNKTFATTYGGDIVKFEKTTTEGKIKYARNKGHAQSYASGAPPGKSCRFHYTPDGGMFTPGKYSWKDKTIPKYLYSEKCYYNFEFTVIVRPGKALGTHQSFAFKIRSRPDKPDDSLRSTIEMCMPNDQKGEAYVNYNYDHKTYAKTPGVKQYTGEKVQVNKWIGVKLVSIVADDFKSHWMGMYVDPDPINQETGQPNNNWKLKAEYTDKGISAYKNIPCTWGGMTNYLRVDGYDTVDVYRYSQVEILKGALKNPAMLDTAPGQNFTLAKPVEEEPADFNSPDTPEAGQHVPQQDPSNPNAPPQKTVGAK